ncbi:single-stranded DNA-binding protein [Kiritimatiellota bacterium B12222]|nr:single-stranded DNA-binding protein [Kiritimatiellota bacterium B12222]
MNRMNHVQLVGKVTFAPQLRTLKNGSKVANVGIGIPESYKNDKGEWSGKMHFVDVVCWNEQAQYIEQNISKGDGVLVLGALQYEQWEGKEGSKHSKLKVKGQKIVQIPLTDSRSEASGNGSEEDLST